MEREPERRNQQDGETDSQDDSEDVGPSYMVHEESGNDESLLYAHIIVHTRSGNYPGKVVKPLKRVQKGKGLLRLKLQGGTDYIGFFSRDQKHFHFRDDTLSVSFACSQPPPQPGLSDLTPASRQPKPQRQHLLPYNDLDRSPANADGDDNPLAAAATNPSSSRAAAGGGSKSPALDPQSRLRALERILDDDRFSEEDQSRARTQLRDLVFGSIS